MLTNLYYLILLIAGFLVGLFLAKLCKEEIKTWRKRLFIISTICLILTIVVGFTPITIYLYKFPAIISLFFIIIPCLTIIWKSYN